MALQTPHDTPYSEPHRFGRARPASRPTVASRRPHPRREPTIRSIAARAARDRAPHGGGHAKRAARLRAGAEDSRADAHAASWPSSKATAHEKACAALRRATLQQGSTQSVIRHAEEMTVGGEAAAPGVLRPPEHTFQACRLEVSNECPPAPYLRAIQQRSKALSAQGRATRQLKQRARARLTRKRQKTRFAAEFKAAAARTNRSRRWARCAISSVISARRRLQRAAGVGEVFFPPSGIGLRRAATRRQAPSWTATPP